MSCRSLASLTAALGLAGLALPAAAGTPQLPIAAGVDEHHELVSFGLRARDNNAVNTVRDTLNNLMVVPQLGRIGYVDLDAGMWSWYGMWARPDSMGAAATAGAWGNFYTDFFNHPLWWLHGHRYTAQGWLRGNPLADPTVWCFGCGSQPRFLAEAFVERVTADGQAERLSTAAPAPSVYLPINSWTPLTFLSQSFAVPVPVVGTLSVGAFGGLDLAATGGVSASLAGAQARLDGSASAYVWMLGSGPSGASPAYALASASISLLTDYGSDLRANVSVGERVQDGTTLKLCARARGELEIYDALSGSISASVGVAGVWNQSGGGTVPGWDFTLPREILPACATLSAPF